MKNWFSSKFRENVAYIRTIHNYGIMIWRSSETKNCTECARNYRQDTSPVGDEGNKFLAVLRDRILLVWMKHRMAISVVLCDYNECGIRLLQSRVYGLNCCLSPDGRKLSRVPNVKDKHNFLKHFYLRNVVLFVLFSHICSFFRICHAASILI